MSKGEVIKFLVMRSIGNFLMLFAIFGVFATFGPALKEEVRFRIGEVRGIRHRVADVHPRGEEKPRGGESLFASLTSSKEQVLIPKDTNFSILIPKIGANAKVFPNVDPSDEDAFLPLLQEGVAHARGTVLPGMKGNIYLFAHSVDTFWNVGRYNAVFYLLKDLTSQDDVVVFFENRRYNYKVVESKVLEASDVSYLVKSHPSAGSGQEEQLILQTCWPPGTTWKRLVIIAGPK